MILGLIMVIGLVVLASAQVDIPEDHIGTAVDTLFTGVLDAAYAVHGVLSLTPTDSITGSNLELDGARGITTFKSGEHTYAAVTAYLDDGVQILNVTDPSNIIATDSITDTDNLVLDNARGITIFKSGGHTYAAVTAYFDDGVQILNVTDPSNIIATDSITDTDNLELDGARGITTFKSGEHTYAAVTAYLDDGVQILNVTDPSNIIATDSITDTDNLVLNGATSITTFKSGGHTYAAVTAYLDDGVQILNVTDPSNIIATDSITDTDNLVLDGARGITTFKSGEHTYAAVTAYLDDGVQILNVTDPSNIIATDSITDTDNLVLNGATSITTFKSGGHTYAAVTANNDDGVQILDVTDPSNIIATDSITDTDNLVLDGVYGITTFKSGGHTYAAVAASVDDGVQIIRIDITTDTTLPADAFITTWRTTTADESITLPISGSGMTVNWGDGNTPTTASGSVNHIYNTAGDYTIQVTGGLERFHLNNDADASKLVSLDQWGNTTWTTMENAFYGADNMVYMATDTPDLSEVTNMREMFNEASNFNGNLSTWNVSKVTDMSYMFADATSFNGTLSGWDVSSVTVIYNMFEGATSFNQDISGWNVSGVTDMDDMFKGATSFNQDISGWNVSGVTDMDEMFKGATSFNGTLSGWDVSSVTVIYSMFEGATSFNQDISGWDVSSVTVIYSMFEGATSFNQDISGWDVSGVTDMNSMFKGATSFNQDISGWDVSSANNMESMFFGASDFNQNLGNWFIVLDSNTFAADVDVLHISTQNDYLDQAKPAYTIGDAQFVIGPDDPDITLNSSPTVPDGSYQVTITVDMPDFGSATHSLNTEIHVQVNPPLTAFVTTWRTTATDKSITLPISGSDMTVDWGDGNTITASGSVSHTYNTAGDYTIQVTGGLTGFHLNDADDASKLVSLDQWGDTRWTTMENAFYGADNMVYNATDSPDLGLVSDMSRMFADATSFNGTLSGWDVSSVTVIYSMFEGATSFNQPLNSWNVSSTTDMSNMFKGASFFNQTLNSWDVSSVNSMTSMFTSASSFDQPLNSWNVSSVNSMNSMFHSASSFNQTLNSWDVSFVDSMDRMFHSASSFNQTLNDWDVSSVTTMFRMFADASSFDQPLNSWNVSSVTNISNMFRDASSFNQPLNAWNVSSVTTMSNMFRDATSFNQPLNAWNVSSVTFMSNMFSGATSFNQPLNSWDVSFVDSMARMFNFATAFSQNLGEWYVVANATSIARADVPGVVAEISAQNDHLNGHNPTYGISSDNDYAFFEIVNGNKINMTSVGTKSSYMVNVTASGSNVFESGNNWGLLEIKVTGQITDTTLPADAFVTTWKTASADQSITINFVGDDMNISWGDGATETNLSGSQTHTYINAGNYTVSVTGGLTGLTLDRPDFFGSPIGPVPELASIDQWGGISWTNMSNAFAGASNMTYMATDTPDLSLVTDMSGMFGDASSFNGNLSSWDVSSVTDMSDMFQRATSFDGDLSSWDVSSVTDMSDMFQRATSFDGDLSSWNVSSVTDMSKMFRDATSFNGNLSSWDVSKVTDMTRMFQRATSFNGDLSSWNVSKVTDMAEMFIFATSFNGNLSSWDVSSITDMTRMFQGATAFNGDLSSWDVSKVTDMSYMFSGVTSFNQPLNSWNVSSVTNMFGMFNSATSFDRPLNSWDVSSVNSMNSMFRSATSFNQPLNSWNVSSVTNMFGMFNSASSFDRPLNTWDVSSVTAMSYMFNSADSFNQPLNSWDVSFVDNMAGMFNGATAFSQNLGEWYVVANATSIARADVPRVVAEISAQNDHLNGHNPTYGIGMDNDYAFFEIVNGNKINMTSVVTKSSYKVNVTASGSNVFESGNNWRLLEIKVTDQTTDTTLPADAFVTTWKTASADQSITINFVGSGMNISWGDGATETNLSGSQTHTYTEAGNHTVSVTGGLTGLTLDRPDSFGSPIGPVPELASIDQWGGISWTNMSNTFAGASNMTYMATDTPDLSLVTDMSDMFQRATSFDGDLSSWDVSSVTDMSNMFQRATSFDGDLSSWDVSSVTDMHRMFDGATSFNGDLSSWDVTKVTDMTYMFIFATSFNGNLSSWDVSAVTDMSSMFDGATSFDQPLNAWGVSSVTAMSYMFSGATSFDRPLNTWDVSSVTDMSGMFNSASSFNQPLNSWNVSSTTDMTRMFSGATSFDRPLDDWNVSSTTDMTRMFGGATSFDQPLNSWNVSSVNSMNSMFIDATSFDQPLNTWDVSSVTTMFRMFTHADSFNQPLNDWDVSSVTSMADMFSFAISFDQNLGEWYVTLDPDTIADTGIPGVVGTISAQNQPLKNHSPTYVIVDGLDKNHFEIAPGNQLNMTSGVSGKAEYSVNVAASGSNVFEDGNNWRLLVISVSAALSDNADLGGLTISSGTLSPQFSSSVITYTASVDNSATQVTVTPTASDSSAAITVNGNDVTSGNGYIVTGLTVGEPTTVTVIVTAQDSTTKTYIITLTRAASLSDNADLGGLTISSGTLSPQFSSSDITYTASVDNSATQVTVTPTASDSSAAITVNGNDVTSGNGYIVTGLTVGEPTTVTVIVTAQDSTTKTYIITLTRAASLSDNADLGSLTISSGTLSPQFSSSDITYTASVDNSATQVTVTPTASDSLAAITVNDNTVTSGTGYIVTGLTVDEPTTVTVIVTAQDSTTKTYIITLTRAASLLGNADLGGLTISSGTLSPQFSSSVITYTASVDNSATQVTVTPTASDSSAAITVNGNDVTSGNGYIVTGLTVGEPTTVTVIVAAQDSTTKTYIITLTRAASLFDNADLGSLTISSGTLSPQFSSSVTAYTASVDNSVTQVTVTPTASDSLATITVNGNGVTSGNGYIVTGLTVGTNTVTVLGIAEDITIKIYTITITRAAAALSDNADLGGLTISSGTLSPQFSSSDIAYTASVDNSVTQVTVTPTASDSSATITVNGNDVTSGNGYIVIGLIAGEPNTVTVIVTAQDSTTKTYTVTLTRAAALSDTPPTFVSSKLDSETGVLTIIFSEDIDATPNTRIVPDKIHIRESGSYTGGVTLTAGELGTTADGTTISFTLNVAHLKTVAELSDPKLTIDPGAVQDTSGNLIEGTFDVSTATYVRKYSVESGNSTLTDVEFSNNGTKMFIVGGNGDDVTPYALIRAFDLTHVSPFGAAFSLSPYNPAPQSLEFSNDGTKMFVIGIARDNVTGYALSTAFDVSTATYVNAFNVRSEDHNPQGLAFSNDGTKMFVVGQINKHVYEYTLPTAFDVSTAVHVYSFPVESDVRDPFDVEFSNDGTKMFVVDRNLNKVHQYTLSTAFDVSTATFTNVVFSVSGQDPSPRGMAFSNDGTKMFVVGSHSSNVNEYALSSVYPLSVVSNMVPTDDHFVTTWRTGADNETVTIPVYSGLTYYYTVIWGDGSTDTGVTGDASHTYAAAGDHQVRIYGIFLGIHLDGHADASKLASIDQWGSNQWASMASAFKGASSMKYEATDAPDLSGVTNMTRMFSGAESFDGDLSSWSVSQVTDMSSMFAGADAFDGDISSWSVSQVTDMSSMFASADAFDGDLSSWSVSQVTDMSSMFAGADAFDGDISSWSVSQVNDMSYMFSSADNFNQPLNGWDVSAVTTMSNMFASASAFNQPLNDWDVSSVTDMSGMFHFALNFNQPLNNWNVSDVTDMPGMFQFAFNFDQNLGEWYVVANATSIARADVPRVVAELSAQNDHLNGHNPTYGISSDNDYAFFEIVNGNKINMTSVGTKSSYMVNVTASGSNVFEDGNNWRLLEIKVTDQTTDTTPPVIKLEGSSLVTITVDDTYTEQGAVCDDDVDADKPATVGGDTVDTSTVGQYTVTYDCTDTAGNVAAQVLRTVNVQSAPDTDVPVIIITGSANIQLTVDETYTEQGAVCDDDVDVDKPATVGGDTVDTSTVGQYTVTYDCTDTAGNVAAQVLRTVNVQSAPDTDAPVIIITGSANIQLTVDETYTEQGAVCDDDVDVDKPATVGGDTVDTSTVGQYTVTYDCTDTAGNVAAQVLRTVNVQSAPDTDVPVIIITGSANIQLTVDETYTEQGAVCDDDVDVDKPATVGGDTVDTSTVGQYTVTYDCTDTAGNVAAQVLRTVNVQSAPDTDVPVIIITGSANIQLTVDETYTEQGAVCDDDVDVDKPATVGGDTVDTSTVGQYTVTYDCTDTAGNVAAQVLRTVNVQSAPDTDVPVIIITGSANIQLTVDETYTEQGAVCDDDVDVDKPATVGGDTVDTSTVGQYTVTYDCTDTAGNVAAQVLRTVNVQSAPDTDAPVIIITGSANIQLTVDETYTEQGAVCDDDVDADKPATVGGDTVDTSTVGQYTVTYDCTDTAGNVAAQVLRTVNVQTAVTPVTTLPADAFITTWRTDSANQTITIPVGGSTARYSIDWGDNSPAETDITGDSTHTYREADSYTVSISGGLERIYLDGQQPNAGRLASIEQWGDTRWTTMDAAFYGARNMAYNAADSPDLSTVTDMSGMFGDAIAFNGDLSSWDVSKVTDMSDMFIFAYDFNGNLSSWDVSSVTNMNEMFAVATSFNGDLSSWDVSKVTDMSDMFIFATSFNGNLSSWDVSSVTNMNEMFDGAIAFNGDLSSWDVSSVTDMNNMFYYATSFNQPLNDWDVSSVTEMDGMFFYTPSFTQNLGNWYVVANATSIARADVPGVVAELSAQNDHLNGHNPTYGISSDNDYAFFEIVNGNKINMTSVGTKSSYMVNVTASGSNVFEDGNNWRLLEIKVTDQTTDTTPPVIKLEGSSLVTITVDDTYTEQGAVCDDDVDADKPATVGGDTVDTSTVGQYTVTYDCTDTAGNVAAQVLRTVNVQSAPDTDVPVIIITGSANIQLTVDETYTEQGAVCDDDVDADKPATVGGDTVDTSTVGQYTVTYDCTDTAGNVAAQVLRTVNVQSAPDTDVPVIIITGSANIQLTVDETYTEQGAVCDDDVDADKPATVGGDTVDTSTVGQYTVTYDCTDTAGNVAAQVLRTVNVQSAPDTDVPVIIITGSANIQLTVDETYTEQGAVCDDDVDADKPATVGGDTVDTSTVGQYTVTYDCTDTAGNVAAQVLRTVNVQSAPDTDVPVIIITGSANIQLTVDETYTEQGAVCDDDVDADKPATVGGDTVDTSTVGQYTVTYDCTDTAGNVAAQVLRTVNVQSAPDTDAPVIIITGSANIQLTVDETYTEQGAVCDDDVDADKPATVGGDTVDTSTVGQYTVTYDCTDTAGNVAAQVLRTVNVQSAPDTDAPVIIITGSANIQLTVDETYTEQGAVCDDDVDADKPATVGGDTVDTSTVGQYTVTYDCTDTAGNVAAQVLRTVNVQSAPDTDAPVIIITGSANIQLTVDETYTEQGAVCDDDVDADKPATVGGDTVDTSTVGQYTVTYDCTDSSNNEATQVSRTVNVQTAVTPVTTLPADAFITTWRTDSANQTITIPVGGSTARYSIDWGDNSPAETDITGDSTHTYREADSYTVSISGGLERIYLDGQQPNAGRLASIEQWGDTRWTTMNAAFEGATNMVYRATDTPDLSGVTDMYRMFGDAIAFNGDLSSWDVSKVTDMSDMFIFAYDFNGNLSSWDVSSVTNMNEMFAVATSFNGDLSSWDVSKVTDMSDMFIFATSFNGNLSSWDVSSVTNMNEMFDGATAFNGDLSSWDVSSVTDMNNMFYYATSFNQPLNDWDVSSVTEMDGMFFYTPSFTQNLGNWYVTLDPDTIADTGIPGVVGTISAQNQPLKNHSPTYVIVDGLDKNHFEIVPGNQLNMISGVSEKAEYSVNVTASGSNVFEDGNNWRVLVVKVSGDINAPPMLNTIDDQTVNEFVELTFTATASDDDSLTFSFDGTVPSGAAITDDGNFTWTPTESQDGDHTITVQVTDGSLTDSETLTVTVNEVNVAPVLSAIGDKGTSELVELTFTATASDTDVVDNVVNTLTFSFDGTFPSGAAITDDGNFTWTPTESQVGSHDITVQVTDGSLTDSETLTVTVRDVNAPPVLNTIDDQTVNEFVELTFTATASDDDSLTFSFDGTVPSGAAITDDGNFTWTPTESQDGDHTITVQVTDGSLTDSETLTVTVNEVNVAPVLSAIGDKGTSELVELTFTATASDTDVVDNVVNTLTFSFDGTSFPLGAAITDDGNFTWTPTELQDGDHTITVQVTDGSLTDSETLTVTVNEVNVAPVLNAIGDKGTSEFVELTFTATASDTDVVDNVVNTLTFSFDGTFPSGAAITDDGNFTWIPTESQDGDHTITVQVTDGSLTDSETLTVTVKDTTAPDTDVPNVGVGATKYVKSGEKVDLRGFVDDPDNTELSYQWSHESGPNVFIYDDRTLTPYFIAPNVSGTQTIVIKLVVMDNEGGTNSDTININVRENQSPVIVLEKHLFVVAGERVILDASRSYDPDNDELSYEWIYEIGPEVSISGSGERVSFIAPVVGDNRFENTVYMILEVTDGALTDVLVFQIDITNNNKPVVNVDQSSIRVASNSTFTLSGTLNDSDEDTNVWWSQTDGMSTTSIDSFNDGDTFTRTDRAPIVESGTTVLTFRFAASDDDWLVEKIVTVTVYAP